MASAGREPCQGSNRLVQQVALVAELPADLLYIH
jgi:hypothetical protein